MDMNPHLDNKLNSTALVLHSVAILLIVSMAFTLHFFVAVFSGYIYTALLLLFTGASVLFKRTMVIKRSNLIAVWMMAVTVLAVSFLHSHRSNGAFLDLTIFVCGLLLLVFAYENAFEYLWCIAAIKAYALFFALGVILQYFLPAVYRAFLRAFPVAYANSLYDMRSLGFTQNAGYSAGYIVIGILAAFSDIYPRKKIRFKNFIFPLFLFLAVALTGKRGPVMFLILTIVFCYLVPVKGVKKVQRYWKIFLVVFVVVIVLWFFRDALSYIPIIGRLLDSFAKVADGEDISSGRTRLYLWAIKLFIENPLFGIGWGNFRTSVVGNVTLATELETHNIYLQLLCETGIIGFLGFILLFFTFWKTTRDAYMECIQNVNLIKWRNPLYYSFAYQTYFLLYGLTGNPLYDPFFQIMFVFSCVITVSFVGVTKHLNYN